MGAATQPETGMSLPYMLEKPPTKNVLPLLRRNFDTHFAVPRRVAFSGRPMPLYLYLVAALPALYLLARHRMPAVAAAKGYRVGMEAMLGDSIY